MNPLRALKRFFDNSDRSTQMLAEIREGIAHLGSAQAALQILPEIREAVANGADRSGQKLAEIREGIANLGSTQVVIQMLAEIREGIANGAEQSGRMLAEIREGIANLGSTQAAIQMLAEIREGIANGADQSGRMLSDIRAEIAGGADRPAQTLAEIRDGIANSADQSGRKLTEIAAALAYLADIVDASLRDRGGDEQSVQLLREIRAGVANLTDVVVQTSKEARLLDLETHKTIVALREAAREIPAVQSLSRSPVIASPPPPWRREIADVNDLGSYVGVFEGLTPYSGAPQKGFYADWSGVMTDAAFRVWTGMDRDRVGGRPVQTSLPTLAEGEGWFEYVNWVEAAREAHGRYVMATLGACYGAQAVGCHRMLMTINPMPCKLIAVEPEPDNMAWVKQHFRDNGIDPDDHWLVAAAISDSHAPVFFPIGAPGTGAQNCFSTNEAGARESYVAALVASDQRDEALRNLLLRNSTGMTKSLTGDGRFNAEIKLVSAVTLEDILGPFAFVDYVEVDIQQSEIVVIPPFMDLLKKKVRRIHIGTHGRDVHDELARLFRRDGWTMIFDYPPNMDFETPYGNFSTNDGILTMRNPDL